MGKMLSLAMVLAVAAGCSAQQAGSSPSTPAGSTPPTFPHSVTMPERKAAAGLSNSEAEQQIREHLRSEPELAGTELKAQVHGKSVKLHGKVQSERQHDLALRIAQSYAGERQIFDKIQVGPRS